MSNSPFMLPFVPVLTLSGVVAPGAKLYFYLTGTTTKFTIYDADGNPQDNPVEADGEGRLPAIYIPDTIGLYRTYLEAADGTEIDNFDPFQNLAGILAGATGAEHVGYQDPAANSAVTNLFNIIDSGPILANSMFGTAIDPTGAANCTTGLQHFLDACVNEPKRGAEWGGTYKVTPGVLKLDNNFVAMPFPSIRSGGYASTELLVDSASTADAPIITIKNGTIAGTAGRYWEGGELSGITFSDPRVGAYVATHGLSIQGWAFGDVGVLWGLNLNGSTVYENLAKDAGDPDAAAISYTRFRGVAGVNNKGYSWENRNDVGMDSATLDFVYGNGNLSGIFFGIGQGCKIKSMSCGSSLGWAFDDGGTTNNRNWIGDCEIDSCQYGIKLSNCGETNFVEGVRFNMRPTGSYAPLNTEGVYWPKKCISLTDGAGTIAANMLDFKTILRLDPITADIIAWCTAHGYPDPTTQTLGVFLDTQSPGNTVGVNVGVQLLNQSGRTINNQDLYTANIANANTLIKIIRNGAPILNNQWGNYSRASYSGTAPVIIYSLAGTGISAATALVAYNSVKSDQQGLFNATTHLWTAPYSGLCRVRHQISLPVSDGKLVRVGVADISGGSADVLAVSNGISSAIPAGADAAMGQSFLCSEVVNVIQGHTYGGVAIQGDNAGGISLSAVTSTGAESFVEFEMI